MAKLKIKKGESHGRVRWIVDLRYVKKGGRKFFETKSEAETFVERMRQEIESGEQPLVLNTRQKHEYQSAIEILGGVSLIEAVTYFVRHHRPVRKVKMIDALNECIAAKRRSGKDKDYLRTIEARVESLAGILNNKTVDEVTTAEIETWLHGRGWEPYTKRTALIDVRTFFNYCKKNGLCMSNPCAAIEQIETSEQERGVFTPEQAEVFIRTAFEVDAPLLRYFADQLFGGLREDEAQLLEQKHVEANFVKVTDTKTGDIRFVEFNPTWTAWRALCKEPSYHPIKNWRRRKDKVRKIAKQKMIKAGVADKDFEYPRNCLRHSFCTYAAKTMGASRAADLAGHSERVQKEHYRRPVTLETAERFWKILP